MNIIENYPAKSQTSVSIEIPGFGLHRCIIRFALFSVIRKVIAFGKNKFLKFLVNAKFFFFPSKTNLRNMTLSSIKRKGSMNLSYISAFYPFFNNIFYYPLFDKSL